MNPELAKRLRSSRDWRQYRDFVVEQVHALDIPVSQVETAPQATQIACDVVSRKMSIATLKDILAPFFDEVSDTDQLRRDKELDAGLT